jgi:hypothetical protein
MVCKLELQLYQYGSMVCGCEVELLLDCHCAMPFCTHCRKHQTLRHSKPDMDLLTL